MRNRPMTCSAADAFSSSCSTFLRFAHLPSPRRARPTRARAECSGTFGRKARFPLCVSTCCRASEAQGDRLTVPSSRKIAELRPSALVQPACFRYGDAFCLRRIAHGACAVLMTRRRAACAEHARNKQGPAALSNGGPLHHSAERTESFDSRSRSLQPPIQRRLRTRPPPQRHPSQIPPRRRRRARRSGRS